MAKRNHVSKRTGGRSDGFVFSGDYPPDKQRSVELSDEVKKNREKKRKKKRKSAIKSKRKNRK